MRLFFGTILIGLLSIQPAYSITGSGDTTKTTFHNKEQKRLQGVEKLFSNEDSYRDNEVRLSGSNVWQDSDDVFKQRLAKLNNTTPFEFVYNDVIKSYIRAYAINRKSTTARILGLSQMYFPLFEEHLAKTIFLMN